MLTSKGKIRLALVIVAFISLGTSLLSLSYMRYMAKKIEEIANKDAKIAELGETMSIKMLDARREEKNYIIYFDTLHIDNNRRILEEMRGDVRHAKAIAPAYSQTLDSIDVLLTMYGQNIDLLVKTIQEDPRTVYRLQQQISSYEQELRRLAQRQRLDPKMLPSLTSDVNISLLSASTKLSAEKSRLFSELREVGDRIMNLANVITMSARESLARNSAQGMNYGVKAQRNTLTLLLIASLLLGYTIYYLPHKIFLPYRKIGRALQALGRGETTFSLPNIDVGDELGELSRSFQEAIQKLQEFNALKTAKIAEVQRNLHRVLGEIREGVFILTPDLTVIYANEAARQLFGIERDVVSQPLKELSALWEVVGEFMEDVEKRGRFEVSLKTKKRNLKKKTVSVIPGVGNAGKIESILIVVK